jgi:hypothetical protein
MMFKNKIYDVLKWIVLVCIPAATTAYVGLSAIWMWPYPDEVAKTSAVICALLGTLLGISNLQYKAGGMKNEDA